MSLLSETLKSKVRKPVELGAMHIEFDAPNPSEQPSAQVERITITAYTKAYYEWIRPKAKKLIASVKQLAAVKSGRLVACDEPCCRKIEGKYMYVGEKYIRECRRCHGTGEYNLDAQQRYEDSRSLPQHKTWRDYNNAFNFV